MKKVKKHEKSPLVKTAKGWKFSIRCHGKRMSFGPYKFLNYAKVAYAEAVRLAKKS